MANNNNKFQLSREIKDHDDEVRAISPFPPIPEAIISCSLDQTVRLYQPSANSKVVDYECVTTCVGHTGFVVSAEYYPFGEPGVIISVSHDKSIIIWTITGQIHKRLENAHEAKIACLTVTPSGHIVTGAWDKVAKVWNKDLELVQTLTGHTNNVLAVLGLPNGDIVTGGGDNVIFIWRNGKQIATMKNHSAPVRSLALHPFIHGFISSSNDCSICGWTFEGANLFQLKGHTNLVYTATVAPNGDIVSASEDKTVKIWSNNTCVETIAHPKCVWKALVLVNGDLITAGADHAMRIFSKKKERIASKDVLEAFDDAVKQSRKGPEGLDIDTLSTIGQLLMTTGKKDGETKIVNNEGNPEAWMWSAANKTWEKFGDVTSDAADGTMSDNNSGKKFLDGKFYDYVFNVETDTGITKKLGYNIGENPYDAAARFIKENDLSMVVFDTIARFIMQNVPANQIRMSAPANDPISGNRYVPSMINAGLTQQQPQQRSSQLTPDIAVSSYAKEALARKKELEEREKQKVLPQFPKKYEILSQANYAGIVKKIQEFNAALALDQKTQALALEPEQLFCLEQMINLIQDTSPSVQVQPVFFQVFEKMLHWPAKNLFPVLDLFRCFVLLNNVAVHYGDLYQKNEKNVLQQVFDLPFSTGDPILIAMALRVATNMFSHPQTRFVIASQVQIVFNTIKGLENNPDVKVKTAYASLLHNFCVHYSTQVLNESADTMPEHLIVFIKQFTDVKGVAPDIMYTLLTGLGTLLKRNPLLCEKAKSIGFNALSAQYQFNPNAKLAAAALQLTALF